MQSTRCLVSHLIEGAKKQGGKIFENDALAHFLSDSGNGLLTTMVDINCIFRLGFTFIIWVLHLTEIYMEGFVCTTNVEMHPFQLHEDEI
jgi:hypothetical protein